MANPQLQVEISARIDGLRDAFNRAIRETNNLDKSTKASLSKIDKNFGILANDIDKSMSKSASSISFASNSVSKSLAQTAVATSKSKNTYLELGRVLQDLPFGFTGIQNNLTQLIPAAGGVGLAFSALISALTFLQVGTDYWSRSLKNNKTVLDDVKKTGDEYLSTLTAIRQASLSGNQNTAKEITELQVLFGAYQNANLPLKARQEAYKELQQQYPSYFGNLKFEREASDKTKTAYDSLTQSILATGRARAAVDLIAKNETRKLENEQKVIDLQKEQLKLQEKIAVLAPKAEEEIKTSTRETAGLAIISKVTKLQNELNDNIKNQNNLNTDSNKLYDNNLQLIKAINQEQIKGAKIIGDIGSTEKEIYKQRFSNRQLQGNNDISPSIAPDLSNNIGIVDKNLPITQLDEYTKLLQQAYYSSVQFEDSLKSLSATAIGSGLADAFSQIGVALADGSNAIQSFGQTILKAFAGFLGELGQMFIKQGIATLLFGRALSLNPLTALAGAAYTSSGIGQIAAGATLSVLGGAISAAGKGKNGQSNGSKPIPAFASGVTNFGGGMALVGEKGAELINLPKGSDVIPNKQSMAMLSRAGGSNISFSGGIAISGRELVLFLDDAYAQMGRNR